MNAIKKAYDALVEGRPADAEVILGKALEDQQQQALAATFAGMEIHEEATRTHDRSRPSPEPYQPRRSRA
jgi:hypothetical protein